MHTTSQSTEHHFYDQRYEEYYRQEEQQQQQQRDVERRYSNSSTTNDDLGNTLSTLQTILHLMQQPNIPQSRDAIVSMVQMLQQQQQQQQFQPANQPSYQPYQQQQQQQPSYPPFQQHSIEHVNQFSVENFIHPTPYVQTTPQAPEPQLNLPSYTLNDGVPVSATSSPPRSSRREPSPMMNRSGSRRDDQRRSRSRSRSKTKIRSHSSHHVRKRHDRSRSPPQSKHSHDKMSRSPPLHSSHRNKRRRSLSNSNECHDYRLGRCFRGKDCKFVHESPPPPYLASSKDNRTEHEDTDVAKDNNINIHEFHIILPQVPEHVSKNDIFKCFTTTIKGMVGDHVKEINLRPVSCGNTRNVFITLTHQESADQIIQAANNRQLRLTTLNNVNAMSSSEENNDRVFYVEARFAQHSRTNSSIPKSNIGKRVCRYHYQFSGCKKFDCEFDHPKITKHDQSRMDKVCTFHITRGCTHGTKCPMEHVCWRRNPMDKSWYCE